MAVIEQAQAHIEHLHALQAAVDQRLGRIGCGVAALVEVDVGARQNLARDPIDPIAVVGRLRVGDGRVLGPGVRIGIGGQFGFIGMRRQPLFQPVETKIDDAKLAARKTGRGVGS